MVSIFLDGEKYPAAHSFGVTYLKCCCIMFLFYGLKNVNESVLRGYTKMKSFLLSNISDLFVRVAMTALLIPFFGLNSFWLATTLGTFLAFMLSSFLIRYHKIDMLYKT